MAKLRIPVLVICAFLSLAIALQTVILLVKKLRDFDIADRMVLPGQLRGQGSRAFADPSQRRFGVAASSPLDEAIQRRQQLRVRYSDPLSACARTTDTPQ